MNEAFLTATDEYIARFVEAHQDEFDTGAASAEKIIRAVADGRMAVERRYYGFAILEVEDRPRWFYSPGANLCYLYVMPEHRSSGVGKVFVRELIDTYAKQYLMTLYASEAWRIEFYEACGFRVLEDMGDGSYLMEMDENDTH